jgi:large subunit ribosomal protein L47
MFSCSVRSKLILGVSKLGQKSPSVVARPASASFHATSRAFMGFDEFFDQKEKAGDEIVTGRAWTAADLRRKSFDDLHKLWFVLYKERNLLLSERERLRRNQRPVSTKEEGRYTKVKRSMGAIKFVLKERSKIKKMLEANGEQNLADTKPGIEG